MIFQNSGNYTHAHCHNITAHKNSALIFPPFKIDEYGEVQKVFITEP